jgi:hypothetical protein
MRFQVLFFNKRQATYFINSASFGGKSNEAPMLKPSMSIITINE